MTQKDLANFLTARQVMAALGLDYQKLYRLVRENKIPHIRVGRAVIFRKEEIRAYARDKGELTKAG